MIRSTTCLLMNVIVTAALIGCAPTSTTTTTVLLVRHAEKESGDDPVLTEAGRRRAQALIDVAARAGVTAVYTTDLRRTRETAQPLADHLGVALTVIDAGADVPRHARAVAEDVRRRHRGEVVVVVGHSNTIPPIVAALGVSPAPAIAGHEFDRLFIVILAPDAAPRLIETRYGAGSRGPAGPSGPSGTRAPTSP